MYRMARGGRLSPTDPAGDELLAGPEVEISDDILDSKQRRVMAWESAEISRGAPVSRTHKPRPFKFPEAPLWPFVFVV